VGVILEQFLGKSVDVK